ncbi:MAG: hypothetical protein AAF652_11075 [Cyanobacteria bacterium P01_C01_bin.72]
MISRYYWFVGIIFLTAIVSVWMNSTFYLAIALGLIAIALLSFPRRSNSTKHPASYGIQEELKKILVVTGLVLFCLIVPQVETNTAMFTSPLEDLKNS